MTTNALTGDRSIQVASWKPFTEDKWREAILFYLNGIWGDKPNVIANPIIQFCDVTLRLLKGVRYVAYTAQDDATQQDKEELDRMGYLGFDDRYAIWAKTIPQEFTVPECIEAGDFPLDVHNALIRFVRSPKVRLVTVAFDGAGRFSMWKTKNRGEYRMSRFGLQPASKFNLEQAETVACWR